MNRNTRGLDTCTDKDSYLIRHTELKSTSSCTGTRKRSDINMSAKTGLIIAHLLVAVYVTRDVSAYGSADFAQKDEEYEACVMLNATGHGVREQTTTSPFVLDAPDTYTRGQSISVTLRGTNGSTFEGFILQARRVDTMERVGNFTAVAGTKQNCINTGGRTLSHSNSDERQSVTVNWTAPPDDIGNIIFLFTVVKTKEEFWVNQTSKVVQMTLSDINISECGTEKSCYREPTGCTSDCKIVATWKKDGADTVSFELEAPVQSNSYYLALGLSKDDEMGDDSVTDCIHSNNVAAIGVQSSYNPDKSNVVLDNKTLGLLPSRSVVQYSDGKLRCRFTRTVSVPTGLSQWERVFSLNQSYRMMLAIGAVEDSGVKKRHDIRYVSSAAVDLTQDISQVSSGSGLSTLKKTHGILMILAWMICGSVAILMPRYYKQAWPGKECADKALWFQIHQLLMVSCLLLTVIGFIIIFVSAGGYSDFDKLPDQVHPPLGIVTTCLVIINPIMAMFRPDPTASRRPIFNKFHFLVGEAAHVCSIATIFLSLYIGNLTDWPVWLMVGYICWTLLVEIMLQLYGCKKNIPSEKYEMNAVNYPDENEARQPENKSSIFKTLLLVVHSLVVIGMSIALMTRVAQ